MSSTDLEKSIVKLRNQGKSYDEIKNIVGCSKGTVSKYCNKHGLQDIGLEKNRNEVSDELKKRINEIYKDHTAEKTANILGVCVDTVIKYSNVDKTNRPDPKNVFDVSNRTRSKIVKRLFEHEGLECSRCGWSKAIGDLHHINGRGCENPHKHSNLSYLCPNCHRLFHTGKIGPEDVMTFEEQIGDLWKKYYYSEAYVEIKSS